MQRTSLFSRLRSTRAPGGIGALRKARWWVADYAFVARGQCTALFSRVQPDAFIKGTKTPVVVLPGIYETWRFLLPLIRAVHGRGHPVHVITDLSRNLMPVEDLAMRLASYLAREDLTDVILLAHSKGGLAGKLAMTGAARARISGMLAVATPFGGSRYALLMPSRGLRALSPRHPSILTLSRASDVNAHIVSVFGPFDPHIPESSVLLGARNVQVDTGGHFRVLAHPQVLIEFDRLASGIRGSR